METRTVIQRLATEIERRNWILSNPEHSNYAANKADNADRIDAAIECLPSGSGYDGTITLDQQSTPTNVILMVPFHHMDEHGGYDGWETYKVNVRPTFTGDGMDIRIRGGRKDHREFIAEHIGYDLAQPMPKEELFVYIKEYCVEKQ